MNHKIGLQDYLVEEEHQRECHMWSFSFITTVLCGMFLLQVLSSSKSLHLGVHVWVQYVRAGL